MLIVIAAIATAQNWQPTRWFGLESVNACAQSQLFGYHAALLVFTLIVLGIVAGRRPWQFGLMLPAGKDWLYVLPIAIACGLTGDLIVPEMKMFVDDPPMAWTIALGLIPLSLELLFRGLVHGMMAQLATIQDCQSRWFFSGPTIGSSLLYALVVGVQVTMMASDPFATLISGVLIKTIVVAAIFGLGAGMIRERSHSILPAWLFHAIAVATLLLTFGPV